MPRSNFARFALYFALMMGSVNVAAPALGELAQAEAPLEGEEGRQGAERQREIEAGTAPDDLATKIMTTKDPETGRRFDVAEMVDQVAIFFLAGHETSAAALAWATVSGMSLGA